MRSPKTNDRLKKIIFGSIFSLFVLPWNAVAIYTDLSPPFLLIGTLLFSSLGIIFARSATKRL